MELSLVDYASIAFLPSEIAAASLYIAMKADDGLEWTPTMEYYSMYSESKLQPCARRIAVLITKTLDGTAKQKVREQEFQISFQCRVSIRNSNESTNTASIVNIQLICQVMF